MVLVDSLTRRMQTAYSRGPLSRFGSQFLLDAAAWVIALFAARLLRVDFDYTRVPWAALAVLILFAVTLQFVIGWGFYLYRGRHPYGSFAEVRALVATAFTVTVIVWLAVLTIGGLFGLSRSTPLIAFPIAFLIMGAGRYTKRYLIERAMEYSGPVENAVVYGAGHVGQAMVRRMKLDKDSPYRPVALIDDDPTKRFLQLDGVGVAGTIDDLTLVARSTGATVLIVTIARADAELLQRVSAAAEAADMHVMVLPPLNEVLAGHSKISDLRDLAIEDIIGRHPVDTEIESVAGYLTGKRVLVTGAGGSIGAELCNQIARFDPAELIMLDRDETSLQSVQLTIHGHGLLDTDEVVLNDIRDAASLERLFLDRRPDVVFHAAALKHLPMLEQYPEEAWKTNVLGTLNVLRAAMNADVATFINVSTDKAANPTSVLGRSKRIAERLTAWAAAETGRPYLSVRFGNVLGSRGSMLPVFTSMIEAGGPLTITHPDVTRYFMTIPEACQLVMQAGGIGEPGEVLILDMGEPVRILDVAQRMVEMSGRDVEIVYTGLRPGEKLHEELVAEGESDDRRFHPKIAHTAIPALDPQLLDEKTWLRAVAPTKRAHGTQEVRTA